MDITPTAGDPRASRVSAWSSAIVLLAVGLAMAHTPILRSGFALMHGDIGDTRLIAYILDHSWQWLHGSEFHRSFWDPPMFFPAKNTLAYSEILLGSAPLFWVWRVMGAGPDTALQLWLLSLSSLNFLLALATLRRGLGLAPWASAAGAFLFAFGAPRLAQSGHFQLFPHFPTMLYVWASLESLRATSSRARGGWIFVAAAAAVVQLYSSFYLGWFLALGTVLVIGIALGFRGERLRLWTWARQSAGTLALAAALGAAAVVPMALGHLKAADEVGLRHFSEVMKMLPRPASWVLMSEHSWLYGWTTRWPMFRSVPADFRHEHVLGIGPLTTLLAVAGLWGARRRGGWRLWAWGALVVVGATLLLPRGVTLWGFFYHVFPGASALRAVSRIGLLMLIPLGIGLAVTLNRLERASRRGVAWLTAPLLLLAVAEQGQGLPAYDKQADRDRVAWVARQVPSDCAAFFLTPVFPRLPWYANEIDALLASDLLGIPTVNGYSGSFPPGYGVGWDNYIQQHEDRTRVTGMLADWTRSRGFELPDRCWVRVMPEGDRLDAALGPVDVGARVVAGEPFTASVTFRNTGTIPWVRSRHFRLGVPDDDGAWGTARFELPADVLADGEVTVALPLRAPAAPGRHLLRVQLLQEWMAWFGPIAEVPVEVVLAGELRAP